VKEGDGSRGGHIIRYTRGGNPVYGLPATRKGPMFSEKTKKIAKGVAIVAGSLAAAAIGGSAAGSIARKGASYQNKAHDLILLSGKAKGLRKAKVTKWAVRNDLLRKGFDKLHDGLRGGSAAVGATGATYGTSKVLKETDKDSAKNLAIGAAAATGAALFTVRVAEYARLAPTLGHAVRVAARKIRKPIKRGF